MVPIFGVGLMDDCGAGLSSLLAKRPYGRPQGWRLTSQPGEACCLSDRRVGWHAGERVWGGLRRRGRFRRLGQLVAARELDGGFAECIVTASGWEGASVSPQRWRQTNSTLWRRMLGPITTRTGMPTAWGSTSERRCCIRSTEIWASFTIARISGHMSEAKRRADLAGAPSMTPVVLRDAANDGILTPALLCTIGRFTNVIRADTLRVAYRRILRNLFLRTLPPCIKTRV